MDLTMLKSVRIGALSYDASQAEHVLQRYCKHIFVLNDSDDYPYSFRGSGTALRFGDQHFVFCCGHQFPDLEPDVIAIRPVVAQDKTITASSLLRPQATEENAGDDLLDMRAFEFVPANYAIPNLGSDFLSLDETSLWPAGTRKPDRFLVFGYPYGRQDVDFDERHVTARVTSVNGTYEGRSASPGVHRLLMERVEAFDPDGMSGGPVFYVGGTGGAFFIGFAGVVIRGSARSEILHFVDASVIRNFAATVPARPLSR
ncbi:hypothetical protein JHFBIEKO_2540 [Methylobacterium mesophilicum]|nr:hypothetical protein JHFBIEKO_2540 [Methylobacterium mesophilicum]